MRGSLDLESNGQIRVRKFKEKLALIELENKIKFDKCSDCNGTGLYDVHTFQVEKANGEWGVDHSWGGLYCMNCRGIGHVNIDNYHIFEKCSLCKGKGVRLYDSICLKCMGIGYLLWIDNIIGSRE